MQSLQRLMLWDANVHETRFAMIDNAQTVSATYGKAQTDYEKLLVMSGLIENYTRSFPVISLLLSQLNTGAMDEQGKRKVSAGVKGGNELEAKVDALFKTGYKITPPDGDVALQDDQLWLGLQHYRYGASGQSTILKIDPMTGYILNGGRAEMNA
jgi:hypothetical protein